jgi:sortase A
MPYSKEIEKLSASELRQLLIRKQISGHRSRVDQFQKSGRVVKVESPVQPVGLTEVRTKPLKGKYARRERDSSISGNRWMDRLLLVVEIIAALGLVAIIFVGANLIRSLNQEVRSAMTQPTLTPTAMINAVVLPSGHTPPTSAEGPQFNYSEIPANLRSLVQAMAVLPIPTAGPEFAQYLRIPAINVAHVIVQGDGWDQLRKGIGQHIGSANPGQKGNMVLSGHNDIYGEVFRHLDQLKRGNEIFIRTNEQEYVYVVDRWEIVSPTDLSALTTTQEPILTLISCYPYMVDSQRIVVVAYLRTSQ